MTTKQKPKDYRLRLLRKVLTFMGRIAELRLHGECENCHKLFPLDSDLWLEAEYRNDGYHCGCGGRIFHMTSKDAVDTLNALICKARHLAPKKQQ